MLPPASFQAGAPLHEIHRLYGIVSVLMCDCVSPSNRFFSQGVVTPAERVLDHPAERDSKSITVSGMSCHTHSLQLSTFGYIQQDPQTAEAVQIPEGHSHLPIIATRTKKSSSAMERCQWVVRYRATMQCQNYISQRAQTSQGTWH